MQPSTTRRRRAIHFRPFLAVVTAGLLAISAMAAPAQAATTPLPNDCVKQTYFVFHYDNGQVDSGCASKNDVTPGTPGTDITVATKLHVSCSDKIIDGVPKKGEIPPGVLITDWSIVKKDGKTCGSPVPPPPPPAVDVSIKKTVDGGKQTTTAEAGDAVTFSLEVEASGGAASDVVVTDTLPDGMTLVSSSGAECSQSGQVLTCELGTVGSGGVLPGENPCAEKERYYVFEYNDSDVVGIDKGCSKDKDATTPIAPKLHLSCSDEFPGGVPEKSDLGSPNRRVAAFFITDGEKKTCGNGTFTPPAPASVTVTLEAKVKESGCNVARVTSSNDSDPTNNRSRACVNIPEPPDSGYLEICEEAPDGTFTFKLGNGMTVSVPAGSCSSPIEVPTGRLTIVQAPRSCYSLTDIETFPPGRLLKKDVPGRTAIVRIPKGDVSTQTIATFTNSEADCPPPPNGQHKVCATSLDSVPTGTRFSGTADGKSFSVRVGYCTLADQHPAGTKVTTRLHKKAGYVVSDISASPIRRLVSANVATRTATVRIGWGVTETVFDLSDAAS